MSITRDVRNATRPRDERDTIAAIRAAHGRNASHFVAEQMGVGIRQAQRYLAGDVKHYPADFEDVAEAEWYMAEALQHATMLSCGSVEVFYGGKSQGRRSIGTLGVDPEMAAELAYAAQEYLNGNEERAEQHLSNAIMGGYARNRDGNSKNLRDVLTVGRFHGQFDIS